MTDRFEVHLGHLLPETLSLAITGALTYLVVNSKAEVMTMTVFPESPAGATLNSMVMIVLVAAGGTALYLLIRTGRVRVVRWLIRASLAFVIFFLSSWYMELCSELLQIPDGWYQGISVATAILATCLMSYAIHLMEGVAQTIAITVSGALAGTFLGVSIPILSAVLILTGLALYDILAVYKGPVGKILKSVEIEDLTGTVLTYGNLTVGLGDLVFYSMLASSAMVNSGPVVFAATALGIIVGAYFGFRFLEKRDMFPGLPFAVGLGIAVMITCSLVQPFA